MQCFFVCQADLLWQHHFNLEDLIQLQIQIFNSWRRNIFCEDGIGRVEEYIEYIQLFMIIIIHINKWLWTWTFYFWSLLVTFGLVDHKTKSILLVEGYVEYFWLYMIIISHINKDFRTLIFYFWSLLVTFGLLVYDTIYIYLHQKFTFGLVVLKTKSNQKWPKVK